MTIHSGDFESLSPTGATLLRGLWGLAIGEIAGRSQDSWWWESDLTVEVPLIGSVMTALDGKASPDDVTDLEGVWGPAIALALRMGGDAGEREVAIRSTLTVYPGLSEELRGPLMCLVRAVGFLACQTDFRDEAFWQVALGDSAYSPVLSSSEPPAIHRQLLRGMERFLSHRTDFVAATRPDHRDGWLSSAIAGLLVGLHAGHFAIPLEVRVKSPVRDRLEAIVKAHCRVKGEAYPVPAPLMHMRPLTFDGEPPEWARGYSKYVPHVHEALARARRHPDEMAFADWLTPQDTSGMHQTDYVAYWDALHYVLVFLLGWSRPGLGLAWFLANGKDDLGDPRLRLVKAVWDSHGQLPAMALWACTTGLNDSDHYLHAYPTPVRRTRPVSRAPILEAEWSAQIRGIRFPYGLPVFGGTNPCHLGYHLRWVVESRTPGGSFLRTDPAQRQAVLMLDTPDGWYHHLSAAGATLPDLGERSWHVDVVVRSLGWLGTFRQSRETGLWFQGRHHIHIQGN